MSYALKFVREDCGSLTAEHGRVFYRPGEVVEAPGNGTYAAVSGGLSSGGVGERIALLANLAEPTGASAPGGVICYRRALVVAVLDAATSARLWSAYEKQRALLWEAYEKQLALLDEAYVKQRDLLDEAYKKQRDLLYEAYEKQRDLLYQGLIERVVAAAQVEES
jgi:hypothetical protein